MSKIIRLKEQYVDLRFGLLAINPIVIFSTFVLIAYEQIASFGISLWLFAPISIVIFMCIVIIVGKIFRKKQLYIDAKLNYEQQTENAQTQLVILEMLREVMDTNGVKLTPGQSERLAYLQSIVQQKT